METNTNEYQDQTVSYPPVTKLPKKSKKAKVWFIILALLLVALSSLAVYFFLQDRDNRNKVSSLTSQLSDTKQQLATAKTELDKANNGAGNTNSSSQSNIEYFTLNDWNVKFIMPKGLEKSDIVYASGGTRDFDGVSADVMFFTTKATMALGGGCNDNSDTAKSQAGDLYRTKGMINEDIPSAPIFLSAGGNDYYYYFSGPQSLCGSTDSNSASIAQQQASLIRALMGSIQ